MACYSIPTDFSSLKTQVTCHERWPDRQYTVHWVHFIILTPWVPSQSSQIDDLGMRLIPKAEGICSLKEYQVDVDRLGLPHSCGLNQKWVTMVLHSLDPGLGPSLSNPSGT
jgi:hypothetical protein